MKTRKRVLTGDRPTGRLHLGHYVGTLANRVILQNDYECFFVIADLHTLTTRPEREHIEAIPAIAREMVLDYPSLGIDPERSAVYLQSAVPEVCELAVLLGNLVTVPRLSRLPRLEAQAGLAEAVLRDGTLRMREEAAATMEEVREHTGIGAIWGSVGGGARQSR